MIGISWLLKLAKLSCPIISVLLFPKLVPIRIANSVVIAQNSSAKDDPPDTGRQETTTTSTKGPYRGPCKNDKSLTALLPREAIESKVLISQENTKLWFYNPYKGESIDSVSLTWEGKSGNLPTPTKPGFVSVSVPPKALPLKDGKEHSFRLVVNVYCRKGRNAKALPDSVPIKIQLQKFNPPPSKTLVQRADIYARKGYSFDALTQLAPLKEKNPNNPNWNEFLKSMNVMGFKIMETKPIIDCCTSKSQKP
ncbi:MAG: DUF928 domain-containing protein [Cyanobacteria bacterium P01_H01_bin.150]